MAAAALYGAARYGAAQIVAIPCQGVGVRAFAVASGGQ